MGNPQRFGQDFVDKVANPRDLVQFHRKSAIRASTFVSLAVSSLSSRRVDKEALTAAEWLEPAQARVR